MSILRIFILLCLSALVPVITTAQATGKPPVIIIPGISGSELVNTKTGRAVWFSIRRDKDDDLRLPMTSPVLSRNRDGLAPRDIIREVQLPVLPDVEVYKSLIDALKARGYTEGDWNRPKATDVFYVFPYDWRRDNVETAHILFRKMVAVKAALRQPGLKFDIIAHSMGGLVARYAAMYGLAELPDGKPVPNWTGAAHIDKLMMFGTPNEGSFNSFEAVLKGYPIIADRKLPLVDDLRAEDVISSPAVFQLIPHGSSARFLDEDLKPLAVDIYDVDTWLKYGWGPLADPKFLGKLRDAVTLAATNKEIKPQPLEKKANSDDRLLARTSYAQVRAYFAAVLSRARRFHSALDVAVTKVPFQVFAYGGNCAPTLDAVVLVRDEKKDRWQTLFESREIKHPGGKDVTKDEMKAAIFALGDGRVTQRSLLGGAAPDSTVAIQKTVLTSSFFACGLHTKLFLEKPIQDSFLSALVVEKKMQP